MSLIPKLLQQCAYDFPKPFELEQQGRLDEHGLICIGGDLSPSSLVYAYYHGMFPWFNTGEPIYWWSPEPRCVIYPKQYQPSKSLVRNIKKQDYLLRIDYDFEQVIQNCAAPRNYSQDTWIGSSMIDSYIALHRLGLAHSIEIWQKNIDGEKMIGGLYGVNLGSGFFGESMFHKVTDASKMAFFALMMLAKRENCPWVDGQLENPHLISLGASLISRYDFLHDLQQTVNLECVDWKKYQHQDFNLKQCLENIKFMHNE
ncbi:MULTISPECIES: leucyl/phenylalanyl-tRNA--protein transferase [unclassified Acinetobacter]|uniref:leucyl/phenylalanyl-tRNA--protein transferase n=1 Tax=unclassified Acinetobacter TaxID=196816 RepID=UPI0035B9FCF4